MRDQKETWSHIKDIVFLSSWSELEQIRSQAIKSLNLAWKLTQNGILLGCWSYKAIGQVYFHNFLKENKCR